MVRHQNAYSIAFHRFQRRTGRLSVVAPAVDQHSGRELASYRFRHEMKLLHATNHFPEQARSVRRDDWWICASHHAERIEPARENGWWREGVSSRGGTCKTRVRARNAGQLLGLQRTNARSDAGSGGRRSSTHFGDEPSSGTDLSSLARIYFAEWNGWRRGFNAET